MVPDGVFLFAALTWMVALCPACRAPCVGESVSIGGGCACQVKEEAPTFLSVTVPVTPRTEQASVNFGATGADVVEAAGETVATVEAVPESASTVRTAEEESEEDELVGCSCREKASAANTATTAKRRPAASIQRCLCVLRRNHTNG